MSGQPPPGYYEQPVRESTVNIDDCDCSVDCFYFTVRIICVISAFVVAALAIFSFIFIDQDQMLVAIFVNIFLILFAMILLLGELGWKYFLVNMFPLLITRVGKGFYLIFLGIVSFAARMKNGIIVPGIIVGIWCIGWGVTYSLLGCCYHGDIEDEERNKKLYRESQYKQVQEKYTQEQIQAPNTNRSQV
ncbi:MAG: hypothetical protein EZS28_023950 [Streblomastix strix]|uniref:COPI associated protein n=1 Tax=Streblomastix strix TaxID=222440 RepID=A0A5J4VDF2_9EUKA|nr:MAG: hypothetical protein EZS28_023950 [Streblomastix strix]